MTEAHIIHAGRWEVALQQVSPAEFKAIANNGCGFEEWATGLDAEQALRRLAEKLGEPTNMFL